MANLSDGVRAIPIAQVFTNIGLSRTRGYAAVASGRLETFTIGNRRFATPEAEQRFIKRCIAESRRETPAERAARVAPATEARARKRALEAEGA